MMKKGFYKENIFENVKNKKEIGNILANDTRLDQILNALIPIYDLKS